MANRFNFEGFGILGLIGGLAAVGYSIWKTNKVSDQITDTTKKLDMSIDDVERKTTVEIDQSIVDAAIDKAVKAKVERAANEAVAAVKADMHQTISSKVKKEIDEQYNRISDDVTTKISSEIEGITKEKLSNTISARLTPELKKYGENKIDMMVSDVRDTAMKNLSTNLDYASVGTKVLKQFLNGDQSSSNSNCSPKIIAWQ